MAESKIKLDGVNNQITITDNQGSPVTRVILGKLSSATDDYGLKVINDSGDVKFQTGSTTFIDGGIITANTVTYTKTIYNKHANNRNIIYIDTTKRKYT